MAQTVYRPTPDCPRTFLDIFVNWLIRIVLYQPPQLIQQAFAGIGTMKSANNIGCVAYLHFSGMEWGSGFWSSWLWSIMVVVGHRGLLSGLGLEVKRG